MEAARTAASKAGAAASRHQEAVAKLTADNLVVLMKLKECEAVAASAVAERDELRLAFTSQQGPWFEQVDAPTLAPSICSPRSHCINRNFAG